MMKATFARTVALIIVVATGDSVSAATVTTDRPSLGEEVARIVQRDFYDPAQLAKFATRMKGGNPDQIGAALAGFGVSHTGRWTRDQIDYYELFDTYRVAGLAEQARKAFPPEGQVAYPGIGMIPRRIGDKTFAAWVYDGSPAARAGMLRGDEILSVDGRAIAEIGSFEGKIGRSVEIRIRRDARAAPTTIAVPVIAVQSSQILHEAIRSSARIIERDGKRLGHVRLWTYAGLAVTDLLTELLTGVPFKDADGLVLDMRCRWGGAPPDAAELFVGGTPSVEGVGRDASVITFNARWRKPLVGIIDGTTRSGMEILAYSLQKAGIRLVGTRTAGAVLGGRPYMLSDKSLMVLAVMDVRVDGKRLEGIGVAPSIEVATDLRYAGGADPQLERAVIVLREQM